LIRRVTFCLITCKRNFSHYGMKYLIVTLTFISFISFNSFAQDYYTHLATHRKQYKADFLTDSHSPLKESDLTNLHFFDADSTYRINADAGILSNQVPFQMTTFNGAKQAYIKYAQITFKLKGKPCQLYIYKNIAFTNRPGLNDYLFLPFTDETNSNDTYGGGRYIDLRMGDIKNGKVEIDFNKAYNPYCAYSEGYQCPMPPAENQLSVKVEAGEKQFTGEKKH
jgi:uncharacterized protein (DUF1684 family)